MDGERSTLAGEDTEAVDAVANLLGLPLPTAKRVLLERQINVRGNVTDIPLRLPEVRRIPCLTEHLYDMQINCFIGKVIASATLVLLSKDLI